MRRRAGALLLALSCLVASGCGAGGLQFGEEDPPKPEKAKPIKTYVALGDGFAAAPYAGKTDRAGGCLRSQTNYPKQVAKRLDAKLVDLTCTGADTYAMSKTSKGPSGKGSIKSQIGRIPKNADLITLTVGINDADLLLRGLYICMSTTGTCPVNTIPAQNLGQDLADLSEALVDVVRRIRDRAPDATLFVVGYPKLVPDRDACKALPAMDDTQLKGANLLYEQINALLQSAALQTSSVFLDIAKVTEDHDLCAAEPWIRAPGDDVDVELALHPLSPEQMVVADVIMQSVTTRR